ncbi:uncharacterized protein LOC129618610 isoform X2 [Condylostylus longicornis]|uniref:uncharacterized protein LOC129618610 isoform X2 n=1 Tax=Condylostylus longicornis TaxID=2530218 RepID=UPI00244E0134|nr:uncharacterized protein LOC129618610 isoform X2 [Condylostylus longicornis]
MKFVNFINLVWMLVILNSVIGEQILSISIPESYSPIGERQDKGKVDPKLDLENSDEEQSSTPSNIPSSKHPKGSGSSGTSGIQGKPSSPKIQGVRVTVDTGPNDSSGSKESVEILEPKKGKRVGIHTDITFEISDDSDTGNSTYPKDKDADDADIPIFKGRDSSTHRPRRPYDPKQDHHWNNDQPPQRHHSSGPNFNDGNRNNYYPGYSLTNDQEYYHSGVSGLSGGGRVGYRTDNTNNRRDNNGWTGYIPMTNIWTTERAYYSGGFKTYEGPQWKPCYCISNDGRNRRQSRIGYLKVDDKLDLPYSSKRNK